MTNIVVVGGGGHAKVLISVLRKNAGYNIVGYTDIEDRGTILNTPYLGTDSVLKEIGRRENNCSACIGVGNIKVTGVRRSIAGTLLSLGFDLPVVVSPDAIVNQEVIVGRGSMIFDGSIINSGSVIGECCIVNTSSVVEHDCIIGDFVHVGPGVALSGGVTVGENSMVGVGSTVLQHVKICENVLVGAGSTIIRNIDEPGVYVGSPARRVK